MKLKTLTEDTSELTDLIGRYLEGNLKEGLVTTRHSSDNILVTPTLTFNQGLTSIAMNNNGVVTLTHYPGVVSTGDEVTMERVSIYDPGSLPTIKEFVNRFDYET